MTRKKPPAAARARKGRAKAKVEAKAPAPAKAAAKAYDSYKEFDGRRYTGMAIGRTHRWHYDRADWKEKKVTPEEWEFAYSTTKRRAGHAPEGSGAPVGTGYHWFILAHQYVEKLNADDYMTQMSGLKFKLAHKRAAKGTWSASPEKRRKALVRILQSLIADLERAPEQMEPVKIDFTYGGKNYAGTGLPILTSCAGGACSRFDLTLNGKHVGILRRAGGKWKIGEIKSTGLVKAIGAQIEAWYAGA